MQYTVNDFKKGQPRWCPGCGDHFFLASFQKAMAEIGVPPYETAVISGIGCSSRLPYYVNTYAMQTIHGRAAAIATNWPRFCSAMTTFLYFESTSAVFLGSGLTYLNWACATL